MKFIELVVLYQEIYLFTHITKYELIFSVIKQFDNKYIP